MEAMCSTAMLQGVGVQAIVTEFLIQYTDVIFDDRLQSVTDDSAGSHHRSQTISNVMFNVRRKTNVRNESTCTGTSRMLGDGCMYLHAHCPVSMH